MLFNADHPISGGGTGVKSSSGWVSSIAHVKFAERGMVSLGREESGADVIGRSRDGTPDGLTSGVSVSLVYSTTASPRTFCKKRHGFLKIS